ncbi:hypothetical protein J1N35_046192 [Gossypium stocksii]|uniref:Uncharacterized protein n=1 Tax=Gossypium stocksii TaxID=47602 RepID=A0A9D3U5C6_9ROSI|nr:hypothetical protein J1N35_046192 [Gossypium stocksii]
MGFAGPDNVQTDSYHTALLEKPSDSNADSAYSVLTNSTSRPYNTKTSKAFLVYELAQSSSSSSSMEALLKEYMAKNDDVIQSQAASLRALENQVGQIASALSSRQQGALPSGTKNSRPQGKEHCKTITLRSGTQLLGVVNDAFVEEDSLDFIHKASSEPIVEQSTIENSKKKMLK